MSPSIALPVVLFVAFFFASASSSCIDLESGKRHNVGDTWVASGCGAMECLSNGVVAVTTCQTKPIPDHCFLSMNEVDERATFPSCCPVIMCPLQQTLECESESRRRSEQMAERTAASTWFSPRRNVPNQQASPRRDWTRSEPRPKTADTPAATSRSSSSGQKYSLEEEARQLDSVIKTIQDLGRSWQLQVPNTNPENNIERPSSQTYYPESPKPQNNNLSPRFIVKQELPSTTPTSTTSTSTSTTTTQSTFLSGDDEDEDAKDDEDDDEGDKKKKQDTRGTNTNVSAAPSQISSSVAMLPLDSSLPVKLESTSMTSKATPGASADRSAGIASLIELLSALKGRMASQASAPSTSESQQKSQSNSNVMPVSGQTQVRLEG